MNETYVPTLEDICTGASTRVHIDNPVLEEIQYFEA